MSPSKPDDDADQQQVETLCAELSRRAAAVRAAYVALAEVTSQSPDDQQRLLVEQARARYHHLRALIQDYCERP